MSLDNKLFVKLVNERNRARGVGDE